MSTNIQKENFLSKSVKPATSSQRRPVPAQSADMPKNSSAHVAKINTEIEAVQLTERTLTSHLKDCRNILDQIKDKADNSTEELNETLRNIFTKVSETFQAQVVAQTKENEKMQQKVDKLKGEKADLQKILMDCAKRCSALEEELGKYPC
jgi:chromosome segregation ATPase